MLTNDQIESLANMAGRHAYDNAKNAAIQANEREAFAAQLIPQSQQGGPGTSFPVIPEIGPGEVTSLPGSHSPLTPQIMLSRIPPGMAGIPRPLNARK